MKKGIRIIIAAVVGIVGTVAIWKKFKKEDKKKEENIDCKNDEEYEDKDDDCLDDVNCFGEEE